jgi:hypothetical protein
MNAMFREDGRLEKVVAFRNKIGHVKILRNIVELDYYDVGLCSTSLKAYTFYVT